MVEKPVFWCPWSTSVVDGCGCTCWESCLKYSQIFFIAVIHLFILLVLCYIYYTYTLGGEKGKIWCTWNRNKRVSFRHSAHTKAGVTGTLLWTRNSRREADPQLRLWVSGCPSELTKVAVLGARDLNAWAGLCCVPCRGRASLSWNMALLLSWVETRPVVGAWQESA